MTEEWFSSQQEKEIFLFSGLTLGPSQHPVHWVPAAKQSGQVAATCLIKNQGSESVVHYVHSLYDYLA